MNIELNHSSSATSPLLGLESIFLHLDADEASRSEKLACDSDDIVQSNIAMASSFMPRYQRTGA